MINKKQTVKNIFTNGIQFFVLIVYGLFLPILILDNIGNELYSVWVLAMSYAGLIQLFDFGTFNALTKFLSQEVENQDEMYKYFSSIFIFISSSLFITLILAAVFLPFIYDSLFPNITHAHINWILMGFLFVSATNLLTDLFSCLLRAVHRFDLVNYSIILYISLNIISIPLFLKYSIDLYALLYSFLFSSIVRLLYTLYLINKLYVKIKISNFFSFDTRYLKQIMKLASSDQLIRGTGVFWNTFIKYIIQKQFGSQYLVAYDLSMRVISQFANFPTIVISTLLPIFSSYVSKNETEKMISLMARALNYLIIVMLPLIVYFIFFSDKIVHLWVGENNNTVSLTISILLVSSFINILTGPMYYSIIAFNKPILGIKKTLIAIFLNMALVIFSILLKLNYYWIIYAEFLSTIASVIYFIRIYEITYKVNLKEPILKSSFKTFLVLFPLAFLFALVIDRVNGLGSEAVLLILAFVVYILMVLYIYYKINFISKYEIDLVRNQLFNKKGN